MVDWVIFYLFIHYTRRLGSLGFLNLVFVDNLFSMGFLNLAFVDNLFVILFDIVLLRLVGKWINRG